MYDLTKLGHNIILLRFKICSLKLQISHLFPMIASNVFSSDSNSDIP